MGSKKLFFNFNMILRDIKMHWPIWVMALAGYTLSCTAVVALGTFKSLDYDYDIVIEVVEILAEKSGVELPTDTSNNVRSVTV